MGYEIVGAVFDERGRPITIDQLRAEMVREAQSGMFPMFFGGGGGAPATAPYNLSRVVANAAGGRLMPGVAASAQRLEPTLPGPVDEVPLPIDSGAALAAGSSQSIATTSQIIFEPRRLIVPSSLAPFFTIDSISVGNVPLFAGAGAIPAEAFSPDSVNPNVRKITANPGVQIIVTVSNTDAVAHRFRAAFFGYGAQPEGCRG